MNARQETEAEALGRQGPHLKELGKLNLLAL